MAEYLLHCHTCQCCQDLAVNYITATKGLKACNLCKARVPSVLFGVLKLQCHSIAKAFGLCVFRDSECLFVCFSFGVFSIVFVWFSHYFYVSHSVVRFFKNTLKRNSIMLYFEVQKTNNYCF